MVTVEINGKKECFRDTDELLYHLRTECNVDLRNVFLSNSYEVEVNVGSAMSDLDCLNTSCENEWLDELKEEIGLLRLNKEKKSELLELIEKINDGLKEHVIQYSTLALESLEKINSR